MGKRVTLLHFPTILVLLALLPAGCATRGSTAPQYPTAAQTGRRVEGTKGWWYVRFKMAWPEGAEPSWYLDLILAHRVVSPILRQFEKDLELWRFHRRAVRDQAGHQFSFIFFAPSATAQMVYAKVTISDALAQLSNAGLVAAVSYDSPRNIAKPNIEDTSDPNWSPDLQKAWPYFVMGASETWLRLIELHVQPVPGSARCKSLQDLQALYAAANDSIDRLWQKEGSHAFLHHLNAIFGYVPVQFYEKRQISF